MSLLIIRGDLQSHSGYSAAIRAYCGVLETFFDRIVGVDIHFGADRAFEPFPHPVVSMAEARQLAQQSPFTLALSCTTPDKFVRLPGAVNVGMTFWESDLVPVDPVTRQPLLDALNCMDALWIPTTHTRDCFERAGVTVPMAVIPWPMAPAIVVRRTAAEEATGLPEGMVYNLDRSLSSTPMMVWLGRLTGRRIRLARWLLKRLTPHCQRIVLGQLRSSTNAIIEPCRRAFVCVAQDAPRKALPLLLAEWMEFKRRPQAQGWSLILKSSPLDPAASHFLFVVRFWEQVQALKKQLGVRQASVFLWTSDLNETDFPRLITCTAGTIACGLGEGFCAPVALAALMGKPVIAPRHTAFRDYLPSDYRYVFATRPAHLSFVNDPLGCYDPMTAWHVPEPLAIAESLSHLIADESSRRDDCCRTAQQSVKQWCDPARVRDLIDDEIARLTHGAFSQRSRQKNTGLPAEAGVGLVQDASAKRRYAAEKEDHWETTASCSTLPNAPAGPVGGTSTN